MLLGARLPSAGIGLEIMSSCKYGCRPRAVFADTRRVGRLRQSQRHRPAMLLFEGYVLEGHGRTPGRAALKFLICVKISITCTATTFGALSSRSFWALLL